jgi:hypothetical protein
MPDLSLRRPARPAPARPRCPWTAASRTPSVRSLPAPARQLSPRSLLSPREFSASGARPPPPPVRRQGPSPSPPASPAPFPDQEIESACQERPGSRPAQAPPGFRRWSPDSAAGRQKRLPPAGIGFCRRESAGGAGPWPISAGHRRPGWLLFS